MALLDILTGGRSSGSRVPPLAMALLGLLAYSKIGKKPVSYTHLTLPTNSLV